MNSLNLQNKQQLKFEFLQNQLREFWQKEDVLESDDYDILVVPSVSIDQREGKKIDGLLHYEERLLFSLIRLRNPHTRLIYLTALPLSQTIIDYYLQLLPGIPFSHARNRLLLLSTYDGSLKPLTQKILERPRLVERIKSALRPGKSYMVCYNSTNLEQELSIKLNIPLLASAPSLQYWGSKSGSREIFAQGKIPHPDGISQLTNVDQLLNGIFELWQKKPDLKRMVIKLNEGFSGEGNAILDLTEIKDFSPLKVNQNDCLIAISKHLHNLRFQAINENWENFASRIPELGAIVEEFIEGKIKRSPSVQGNINPKGEVKILSTHDQILGGKDGQIYLGCYFPADEIYRLQLQEIGLKVGQILAQKGAMERYSVDFVASFNEVKNIWDIQAVEINLRKGGTTHPFMTLKLLTNGYYDLKTGLFYTQEGQAKYYIATDNLKKDQYRGLLPSDLMDLIAKYHLHFDSSSRKGTVFHLMGALSEFGKLGLTSIGDSLEDAKAIYDQVEAVLDQETSLNNHNYLNNLTSSLPITWTS